MKMIIVVLIAIWVPCIAIYNCVVFFSHIVIAITVLQIWQRTVMSDVTVVCGSYGFQSGETSTNALYVQFYSDLSVQASGFHLSYTQLKGMSLIM